MLSIDKTNKIKGTLYGLICCDALGTTNEFIHRSKIKPITNIVGGGFFNLKPGEWTDDSSMALCILDSFNNKKTFDPEDQIQRYVRWYNEGYLSSNGRCFDIGGTTRTGIINYMSTKKAFSGLKGDKSVGNGSIMRLSPVPAFFHKKENINNVATYGGLSSLTTHGAPECIDSCKYLSFIIWLALNGYSKEEILNFSDNKKIKVTEKNVIDIMKGYYKNKTVNQIKTTGYVIHTLEAALWAFYTTDDFKTGALLLANLGDDADTVCAVYGQIAGAYYGFDNMPRNWIEILAKSKMLKNMINDFLKVCDH